MLALPGRVHWATQPAEAQRRWLVEAVSAPAGLAAALAGQAAAELAELAGLAAPAAAAASGQASQPQALAPRTSAVRCNLAFQQLFSANDNSQAVFLPLYGVLYMFQC